MAKELPYFRFSPGDWLGGKISAFGAVEQGVYINLVSIGWQKLGEIEINPVLFCKKMEISAEQLNTIIAQFKDAEILLQDDDKYCIKFIEEQLSSSAYISKVRRKAAENRYKKQPQKDANAYTSDAIAEVCIAKTDEMKGNETKGNDKEYKTPIIPKGDAKKDAFKIRVGAIFNRKPETKWGEKENSKFNELFKRTEFEKELVELEAFYKSEYEYKRHDLITFLNNWLGELDKARNWKPSSKLAVGQKLNNQEGQPAWNNL